VQQHGGAYVTRIWQSFGAVGATKGEAQGCLQQIAFKSEAYSAPFESKKRSGSEGSSR
jgi:hypothetical protein